MENRESRIDEKGKIKLSNYFGKTYRLRLTNQNKEYSEAQMLVILLAEHSTTSKSSPI